ncbi:MAG TPA: GAF domain-containing protein, partial [Methylomirabilota bacterium]
TLASVLRAACEQARVTREATETARQLEELNAIGVRLSGERDTKLLLDLILTKARTITRSDAGSIYLVEQSPDGTRRLRFELAQNDSVPVEFNAVSLPLTPRSLAGHVALSGELLHVDDAYALPEAASYRFNPEVDALAGYRTKSMLVLPMKTPEGDVIGVLELINGKRESGRPFASTAAIERDAQPYSEASRNLAASLASQAAVALSNSQLFRELTRRQSRLEALVEVSQRVTRLWPPATVQRRIADLYGSLLQAEVVAFHLVDGERLVRVEARGEGVDSLLPAELATGEGPAGEVIAAGASRALSDVSTHSGLGTAQREVLTRLGLRAWLSVPVQAGERLVGVLTAVTGQAAFSDDDVAVAATFAAQAGIAMENSRLYAELERALEDVQKGQDQLVQVERLRALGEMAAGVAHDFNNLLAVVLLRAELLLARKPAADVAESLSMIRQAAHDGAQTVRRIQEFTRTRSSRPFSPVDVPQLLHEVVELARPRWRDQAQSHGVTYDVQVDAGVVPEVAGTAEELREALLNLLNNALEAMPAGGRFTFRSGVEGGRVVIRAEDSGCGMSEETRRRVFEPFFTTKGAQGNGLGLAVVWGIIARHGGDITVESAVGRGTTFVIGLPIPSELPAASAASGEPVLSAGKRILLAEDNVEIRRSLAELLREHG